jgi:hypothetical protein
MLDAWLRGDPPTHGASTAFVLLDPFATGRQQRILGLDAALGNTRSRVRGYADAAGRLRRGQGDGA